MFHKVVHFSILHIAETNEILLESPKFNQSKVAKFMDATVILKSFDPNWKQQFAQESAKIKQLAGSIPIAIEHVGSTAIDNLLAKPTIDILVGVDSLQIADDQLVSKICGLGYTYIKSYEKDAPYRRYFEKCDDQNRHLYHVHMVPKYSNFWNRMIFFRDYLITHPDQIKRYGQLKEKLAENCKTRLDYTKGKSEFVKNIEQKRFIINLEAIDKSILVEQPFRYAVIRDFLNRDITKKLISHLPKENYHVATREAGSDKTYYVSNNLLKKLEESSQVRHCDLDPCWQQFSNELQSEEYIKQLSQLSGIDLTKCFQEITLKRYGYQNYISAHTDKSGVTATHLLFLNLDWDLNWGGELCFHLDPRHVFKKFTPKFNESIFFIRADNSWHSVDEIVEPVAERFAIQVAFWNTEYRTVLPGREQVEKTY